MWKEMARIIGEVRPRYVFVENSPMLTTRGLGVVLGDLAALGFDAEWGVLSAADVGANHLRERIWILGYSNNHGQAATKITGSAAKRGNDCAAWQKQAGELERSGEQYAELANAECNGREARRGNDGKHERAVIDSGSEYVGEMANTERIGCEQMEQPILGAAERGWQTNKAEQCGFPGRGKWWLTEPDVGRVADGVDFGVDRLKCLGNGQVPAVAATAFELLRARFE
jgi:DNA (cytosine-5)-methyltransferase 1